MAARVQQELLVCAIHAQSMRSADHASSQHEDPGSAPHAAGEKGEPLLSTWPDVLLLLLLLLLPPPLMMMMMCLCRKPWVRIASLPAVVRQPAVSMHAFNSTATTKSSRPCCALHLAAASQFCNRCLALQC
jgi:hypothetical protein